MPDNNRLSASWEHLPCISTAWSGPVGRPGIINVPPAGAMNEIRDEWRIVARRLPAGDMMTWQWNGDLAEEIVKITKTPKGQSSVVIKDGPERAVFKSMVNDGSLSTVQGRDDLGIMCLYARWMPKSLQRRAA